MAQVEGSFKLTLHYPEWYGPSLSATLRRLTPFFAPAQDGQEPAYVQEALRLLRFNHNGWRQPLVTLSAGGGLEQQENVFVAQVDWWIENLSDVLDREELREHVRAWETAMETYLDAMLGALAMCESGCQPRHWVEDARPFRFDEETEANLEERERREEKLAERELVTAHREYERSRV